MKYTIDVYDWRMGLDSQQVWALRALNIVPGEIRGMNGRLKGAMFTFSFHGDRERAKYVVYTFLEDHFGAKNIAFFANPNNPRDCYAQFDMNKRYAENEQKHAKAKD